MYCPNCGQQQISDEMRFCSRCGLALSGLMEWLAGGRAPAKVVTEEKQVATVSPRRKGMRRAAKILFFAGVLFPIFLAISIAIGDGGPMLIPFFVFFVGLVFMLYARLFSAKTAPIPHQVAQTSVLDPTTARGALPPAVNIPMPGFGRQQVRTNELAQPPSVTENTTRLLDNE